MRPEIENFIKSRGSENLPSGLYWLGILDDDEGQPCYRTFALRKNKAKGIRTKEVVRQYLNGDVFMHGDLYFCGAGGWKVMFEKRDNYSYYMPCELDDHWYQLDSKQRPGMCVTDLFSCKDAEAIFKKYIPYFVLAEGMSVMEYAIRYKEYPSAEQLVKAGYSHLIWDKRVLTMNNKQKKKLIAWLNSDGNGQYVKQHRTMYADIQKAMKRKVSIEKYYYEIAIDKYEEQFKLAKIKRTRAKCEEVYKYLNNPKNPQNIGLHDYIDYLGMAKQRGFNMKLKSILYPRDCARAHDSLVASKKAKESRAVNNKLKKISSILLPYQKESKGLKIVFPTHQRDFIQWGKDLSICVGTYGYDKKMADGNCIILMVYCNDVPLECCELGKKPKGNGLEIIQLRGAHNQSSPRHDECQKLVNGFIRNYQNQHVIGACV